MRSRYLYHIPVFACFIVVVFVAPVLFLQAHDGPDSDAVLLRYIHREGQVLHADALVREQVFIDGYYSHDAEIIESSLSRILSVLPDGSADIRSEFITDEWIVGSPAYREWQSSEVVVLNRRIDGSMDVPDDAARPVLRGIPVFPDTPVHPGDVWTAPAEEVHVFRIGGRVWGPYRADIQASYRYVGDEWIGNDAAGDDPIDKIHMGILEIDYNLYLPVRLAGEPVRLISGTSSQRLYWDINNGAPFRKEETFEFLLVMSDGSSQEFLGAQTVNYRLLDSLDRAEVLADLGQLDDGSIDVRPVDRGILLTLDESSRILFAPESSEISRDQMEILNRLSDKLGGYGDRDILISGHTADYGNEEGRRLLSRLRAEAVADILFPGGRNGEGQLFIRGSGATEPVGSDAENRRVEILILD